MAESWQDAYKTYFTSLTQRIGQMDGPLALPDGGPAFVRRLTVLKTDVVRILFI